MKTDRQIELIQKLLQQSETNRAGIAKATVRKPKANNTRNPEYEKIQQQAKDNNYDGKTSKYLKNSLKYKDFRNGLMNKTGPAQLEQYIRAVLLLKQGFNEVERHVIQYDPNIDLVENTLKQCGDLI